MGKIRRALPEEAERITDLMLRSKAYWGYPAEWMEGFRLQLGVTPQDIRDHIVAVDQQDDALLGMVHLILDGDLALLDALFVAPEAIGTGCGKCLFHYACKQARDAGYSILLIESDPNAEGFYLKMGAVRVGQRESAIPERFLPILHFDLAR